MTIPRSFSDFSDVSRADMFGDDNTGTAVDDERVRVVDGARKLAGPDFRHEGMTNRQIKEMAIKKFDPKATSLSEKSGDYVDALFDAYTTMAERDVARKAGRTDMEEQIRLDEDINERLRIIDQARTILGPDFRADVSMSNRQIMETAVLKVAPRLGLADKPEAAVRAWFEAKVVDVQRERPIRHHAFARRNGGEPDIMETARDEFVKEQADAWKKPLGEGK